MRSVCVPEPAAADGDYCYDVDDAMVTTAATVGTVGWPAGAENVQGTTKTDSKTSEILMAQSNNRRSFPDPADAIFRGLSG